MSRPIWKGHISFGLVNVPVVLYAAERRADLSFRLLKLIQRKIDAGRTETIDVETADEEPAPRTINFMDVLKKSVEHTVKSRTKSVPKAKKPLARGRRPKKQRAG